MATDATGYIVASNEGSTWDGGPGWAGHPTTFKLLSNRTGGIFAVFESVVPPGAGTPLHVHHTSDEVAYILSGEFTVRLGEETKHASAGAWIFIPRASVHGWRNSGAEQGRAFFLFAPGVGAAAFEEMALLGMPPQEIDPAIRDAMFARAGFELIALDWE